jgi:hypothetical protein
VRLKPSSIIVAGVMIAYLIYFVLRFAGVVGHAKDEVPAAMVALFILLAALLVADLRRTRRNTEGDNG